MPAPQGLEIQREENMTGKEGLIRFADCKLQGSDRLTHGFPKRRFVLTGCQICSIKEDLNTGLSYLRSKLHRSTLHAAV
jgi:hypothetical protein